MKHFFTVVWREVRVSVLLGVVMALVVFSRAWVMGEPSIIGLIVGATTCLVVIVGATAGAALPLIGKRLGLDPAVFSAPLITTIVDGVGLIIYFNVAVQLLQLA